MKLQEALRKTIREYGISVIREKRLMGFLGDCRAFDEYPAVRDVMKAIVTGDCGKELCRLATEAGDKEFLRFADNLKDSLSGDLGFRQEFADYAVDSVSFALGIASSVREPQDRGFDAVEHNPEEKTGRGSQVCGNAHNSSANRKKLSPRERGISGSAVDNARKHCSGLFLDRSVKISRRIMTLFFLIDTSESMAGSKIGAVNDAMRNVLPMIGEISEENPDAEIRGAVLLFSRGARWVYDEPRLASDFVWPEVSAEGSSSDLGAACRELGSMLSGSFFVNRPIFAPFIMLVSGSKPTDDFDAGLEVLKENRIFRKAIRAAFAVGEDTDREALARFTGSGETVLTVHNIDALKQIIRIKPVDYDPVQDEGGGEAQESAAGAGNNDEWGGC